MHSYNIKFTVITVSIVAIFENFAFEFPVLTTHPYNYYCHMLVSITGSVVTSDVLKEYFSHPVSSIFK